MSDESKTIRLADKSESALHWTIDDMLADAIRTKGPEGFKPNKAVLVMAEFNPSIDGNDSITMQILNAGCNDLELNGLLELASQVRANGITKHG